MTLSLLLTSFCAAGWLYLAFFNGKFWAPLLPNANAPAPAAWPRVSIIVPARNEAAILPETLPSLLAQNYPGSFQVILVDDHSTDGTADVAKALAAKAADRLVIVSAPDLPKGWSGKVAAMQAGVAAAQSDYILFTDADIRHDLHSLQRLVEHALDSKLDLTSRMVQLQTHYAVEKFLIPAFVFFFAMLYPFRKANNPRDNVAAAAGGTMLVRRQALENAGGLAKIKGALIDDCALARLIKDHGGDHGALGRIELTLTHDILSLRPYPHLMDIVNMIARTAYTQLAYSPLNLLGSILALSLLFLAPVILPLTINWQDGTIAYLCWLAMAALYAPMVRFFGLSWFWALTLPAAAVVYMAGTVLSALRYARGQGGQWKGRHQAGQAKTK